MQPALRRASAPGGRPRRGLQPGAARLPPLAAARRQLRAVQRPPPRAAAAAAARGQQHAAVAEPPAPPQGPRDNAAAIVGVCVTLWAVSAAIAVAIGATLRLMGAARRRAAGPGT
jgi:hypothetical protein